VNLHQLRTLPPLRRGNRDRAAKKMYYATARDQCTKAFTVLPPNGWFEINVDALNDSEFSCDAWIE
jgi:hypothetical protein